MKAPANPFRTVRRQPSAILTLPPQGPLNTADNPESLRSDGPHNEVIEGQFPSQKDPPATDISTQPFFWSSFNISPKRIQNGGWARELTSEDFTISEEIAGVNMHLAPGGIRELHWHQTAEWAIMTRGKCRITTIDAEGRPSIDDVEEGDLWFFPAGLPHSLQGLGPEGAEFVLAFDNGKTVREQYAAAHGLDRAHAARGAGQEFGVPKELFRNIPLNNLWIFQGAEPGDLAADRAAAGVQPGTEPVVFRLPAPNQSRKPVAAAFKSPTAPISRSPEPWRQPWSRSSRAGCERCTGTQTPTNGNITCAGKLE